MSGMPPLPTGWTATVHGSIAEVAAEAWNACAGDAVPYLRHEHLAALEASGIAVAAQGFTPRHVVLRDASGAVVAAAPAYLKMHSRGELGVDLGLQLAHQRSVGPYYPKLQVEVPMTPTAGPRLLLRPGQDAAPARAALLAALWGEVQASGASSLQVSYMLREERTFLESAGMIASEGNTYVWHPSGVASLGQLLARMHGRRRSMIARERREVAALGLDFRRIAGRALDRSWADRFFALYTSTYDRKHNAFWLNPDYFAMLFRELGNAVEILAAHEGDACIAAVLFVRSPTTLYAQHWGQSGAHPFLHFEMALYRGIERALELGVDQLDVGALGRHKAPRGIGIEATHHAARFRSPAFREVAEAGLGHRRAVAAAERASETARLPYVVARGPGR